METLVLVLTDVQGSTRLWQDESAVMDAAMRRHHEIVHGAVAAHGGFRPVDQGEGDAVFAAFRSASEAVAAVVKVQRELADEAWPTSVPLRVRIGVHVGEVTERAGNLYGDPVNRCARLRGLGAGGQTLLSAPIYELVRDKLPTGASVTDLGQHRMKDLTRPEHVWQLDLDGLPTDFAPLSSLDRALHNLPVQPSPLIGRETELATVLTALESSRLVTLTGFGGMGKTRLALQVAAELANGDGDGVWFVDLSSVTDPAAVPGAVGLATGFGGSDAASVISGMSGQRLLLVLDNLEQVMGCAPFVRELLDRLPGVKVLATSREPLRLAGERELALAPLSLPPVDVVHDAATLTAYAAVQLFVERAVAVNAAFAISNDSAPAVAAICQRLDGHPLAIELAAARVRMMTPQALLPRLDQALSVLTGGRRDMPGRHQTLRAAIAWSYDLLPDEERLLLARISVFAGPVAFEHLEAVCGEDLDVFDALASLVEKSLVRVSAGGDGEDRYGLLASIKQFAAEQLEATGGAEALRDRHLAHVTAHVALRPPYDLAEDLARHDRVRALYDELEQAWTHALLTGDEDVLLSFPDVWFREVFGRTQDSGRLDALLRTCSTPSFPLVAALGTRLLMEFDTGEAKTASLVDRLQQLAAEVGTPEARMFVLAYAQPEVMTLDQRRERAAQIDHALSRVSPTSPDLGAHLHGLRDNIVAFLLQFVEPDETLQAADRSAAVRLRGLRDTSNLGMAQTMLGRWEDVLVTAAPVVSVGVPRLDFGDAHMVAATYSRALVQLGRAQEALDLLAPWTAEADRRGWRVPQEVSAFSTAFALCELGRADDAQSVLDRLAGPDVHRATPLVRLRAERLSGRSSEPSAAQQLVDGMRPDAWGLLTVYLSALVELALRTADPAGRGRVLDEIASFDSPIVLPYGYQADLDQLRAEA